MQLFSLLVPLHTYVVTNIFASAIRESDQVEVEVRPTLRFRIVSYSQPLARSIISCPFQIRPSSLFLGRKEGVGPNGFAKGLISFKNPSYGSKSCLSPSHPLSHPADTPRKKICSEYKVQGSIGKKDAAKPLGKPQSRSILDSGLAPKYTPSSLSRHFFFLSSSSFEHFLGKKLCVCVFQMFPSSVPPSFPPTRLSRGNASPLLALPDFILERIIRMTFQPPSPSRLIAVLLLCRRIRDRGLAIFYQSLNTSRLLSSSCHRCAFLLDPSFDHRVMDYTNYSFSTTTQLQPPAQNSSTLFPFTPANAFATAIGPLFRHHIIALHLMGRFDAASGQLRPNWAGRGFPLATIPVIMDVLRLRLPNLRKLWLDLPPGTRVPPHQQQAVDTVVSDILARVCKFGQLELLLLDIWTLRGALAFVYIRDRKGTRSTHWSFP